MNPDERACPVCGEAIKRIAKKCKHCGEWLEVAAALVPETPSPAATEAPSVVEPKRVRNRRARIPETEVAEVLSALVSRSLVAFDESSGRYRLLETVRQYSRDRLLESGQAETWRNRHLGFYLALAEEADPQLAGAGQQEWLLRLETEHENLRSAVEWGETSAPAAALRLTAVLAMYWYRRSYVSEGRARLQRALLLPDAQERTLARARAFHGASMFATLQRDFAPAKCWAEEGLEIAEEINAAAWIAGLLNALGCIADCQAEYRLAREYYERSLAISRQLQDVARIAISLGNLGQIARSLGNLAEAEQYYMESLALGRQIQDVHAVGWALGNLGLIKIRQANYDKADELLRESLAISQSLCFSFEVLDSIQAFGFLAAAQAQWERAVRLWGASAAVKTSIGASPDPYEQEDYHRELAAARTQLGVDEFRRFWTEGEAMTLEQAIELALSDGSDDA